MRRATVACTQPGPAGAVARRIGESSRRPPIGVIRRPYGPGCRVHHRPIGRSCGRPTSAVHRVCTSRSAPVSPACARCRECGRSDGSRAGGRRRHRREPGWGCAEGSVRSPRRSGSPRATSWPATRPARASARRDRDAPRRRPQAPATPNAARAPRRWTTGRRGAAGGRKPGERLARPWQCRRSPACVNRRVRCRRNRRNAPPRAAIVRGLSNDARPRHAALSGPRKSRRT